MNTQTKTPSKILNVSLWAAQGLLAFAFLGAGVMKLTTPQAQLVADGMAWAGRVPEALIPFIGAVEVLGALGLLLPAILRIAPKLTPLASVGLLTVMGLAGAEHALNGEFSHIVPAVVLGGLAGFVAWGRLRAAPINPRTSNKATVTGAAAGAAPAHARA
jgi:hypothetical protein